MRSLLWGKRFLLRTLPAGKKWRPTGDRVQVSHRGSQNIASTWRTQPSRLHKTGTSNNYHYQYHDHYYYHYYNYYNHYNYYNYDYTNSTRYVAYFEQWR